MAGHKSSEVSILVRIESPALRMPPVRGALVLGKDWPIGCETVCRALKPLHFESLEPIEPHDDKQWKREVFDGA